jgi:hypothetical protein
MTVYGCQDVIKALNLPDGVFGGCCSSCHSEADARDYDGVPVDGCSQCGILPDGREYEEVCCSVQEAVKQALGGPEPLPHRPGVSREDLADRRSELVGQVWNED